MAISIEELDTTVRAFYEGRGDQVSCILLHDGIAWCGNELVR